MRPFLIKPENSYRGSFQRSYELTYHIISTPFDFCVMTALFISTLFLSIRKSDRGKEKSSRRRKKLLRWLLILQFIAIIHFLFSSIFYASILCYLHFIWEANIGYILISVIYQLWLFPKFIPSGASQSIRSRTTSQNGRNQAKTHWTGIF